MNDITGQSEFNALLAEHLQRFVYIEERLGLSLPARYQFESYSSGTSQQLAFQSALRIGYSLIPTIKILENHTNKSRANREIVFNDLRKATTIKGFWPACESHGKWLGYNDRTYGNPSARAKFISKLDDPQQSLAASFILESLATVNDQSEQQDILRKHANSIAELLKIDGFPCVEFNKLLAECARKKITTKLPRTLKQIQSASPRDRARALWISHHLWLMDATSRCLFLTGKGDAETFINLSKLVQPSGDGFVTSSQPMLIDYDLHARRFPQRGGFCPSIELILCQG
jgi:hypothetical protein